MAEVSQMLIVLFLLFVAGTLLVLWLGRKRPYPWTFHARVTWVCDGDTVYVRTFWGRRLKLRLIGMDAPESKQLYGKESQRYLDRLVRGRFVQVTVYANDRYGRYVAKVMKGKVDASLAVIEAGYAWAYIFPNVPKADARAYRTAESQAKKAGRGLWSRGKPEAPWNYRKRQRNRWQLFWAELLEWLRKIFR